MMLGIRHVDLVDCDFCLNEDLRSLRTRFKMFKGYRYLCEECYEELKATKWGDLR